MKTSLVMSSILAAVFLLLGWRNHTEFVAAQREFAAVKKPARAVAGNSKRPREHNVSDAEGTIRDALDFLRWAHSTAPDKSALKARDEVLSERIDRLNGTDLVALAAALSDLEDVGGKYWEPLVAGVLFRLAADYPRDSLAFIRRLPKLPGKLRSGDAIIARALRNLAEQDPAAAVAWLQAVKGTPLVQEAAKLAVVGGIAQVNPVEAFKAISALQVTELREAGSAIVSSGEVSERGGTILEGMRWYLASHDGEDAKIFRRDLLAGLARRLNSSGFASLQEWVAANPLTQGERASIATGLSHGGNYEEAPVFLPWIAENLTPDLAEPEIAHTITRWTGQDSLAAGKWLADQPAGDLRDIAAAAYAKQIAPQSPDIAARWALTLPPGKRREKALRDVRDYWPLEDPAGAEAFARENGLEQVLRN